MSDKVKFIRLHDDDRDKICLINMSSIMLVYYDWDKNATVIEFHDDSYFTVRESVEEVERIIDRINYM